MILRNTHRLKYKESFYMSFRDEELGVSGKRKNKDCVEGRKMSGPEDGINKWRLEKLE
jgi:hypothetical protein